jgi:hypothetical protein
MQPNNTSGESRRSEESVNVEDHFMGTNLPALVQVGEWKSIADTHFDAIPARKGALESKESLIGQGTPLLYENRYWIPL